MKELFIEAHEDLIAEYLDDHPNATEQQAYDATAGAALYLMSDMLADRIDAAHDRAKYGD